MVSKIRFQLSVGSKNTLQKKVISIQILFDVIRMVSFYFLQYSPLDGGRT